MHIFFCQKWKPSLLDKISTMVEIVFTLLLHLRCFPMCRTTGHVHSGYCGRPLSVSIQLGPREGEGHINLQDYIFLAEMRPSDMSVISSLKHVDKQWVSEQLRSKYDRHVSTGEVYLADVTIKNDVDGVVDLALTFNKSHCSWDVSEK